MNVKPLALAALIAISSNIWAAPAIQSVDRVLAVVDRQVITLGEFQNAVYAAKARLPKGTQIDEQQFQSQVLGQLVDRALMVQFAQRTGIQVTDGEIKNNLNLAGNTAGMSTKQIQERVRDQLLIEKLKQRDLFSKIRVSDAEISQVIDVLPPSEKKNSSGHTITAYLPEHILIAVNAQTSDAEALAKIKELRTRINQGESFEALARANSQDPGSAANGGILGWTVDGMLVPEFENTMKSIPVGALSEPIRTSYGYHLIKVLQTRQQDAGDAQLRAKVRQQIQEARAEKLYESWIQQLRQNAFISVRQ